ncbi:MAG: acyl carrier protein [Planctomycetaceae bacterium]|jgi:acyl carrier protein|nr:acyl carrier protein [Planctomycetaceae bacterium]
MADTKERVIKIIADHLGQDASNITETTDIANDLGADSLDLADLIITFEEEFNINIDESEAQNLTTVGDVIKQVDKAIGGQ